MILDADDVRPGAPRSTGSSRCRGRELPRRLKTELFASVFETNTNVSRTRASVATALRALRRAAATRPRARRAGAGRGRHASVRARRRSSRSSKEERYIDVRGLRRRQRSAGRACRGCTSTSACRRPTRAGAASSSILPWLPVVLALSANSPWLARRADRHGVEPRAGARRAAAGRRCRPAFASYAEWEAWVARLVAARRRRGLHAHLVGRPAAPAGSGRSRCACPTSRPTSALGRVRRARPGAVRHGARGRPAAERSALADRGRADYAQNRWAAAASARAPSCCIPTAERRDRGRARRRAARARRTRRAQARRRGAARAHRPASVRGGRCQLEPAAAQRGSRGPRRAVARL